MKTYDEVTKQVLEGVKLHRMKVRKIQYAASVTAVCTTCILGLTLYLDLEKPSSIHVSNTETRTETVIDTLFLSNSPHEDDTLYTEICVTYPEEQLPLTSEEAVQSTFVFTLPVLQTDPTEPPMVQTTFPMVIPPAAPVTEAPATVPTEAVTAAPEPEKPSKTELIDVPATTIPAAEEDTAPADETEADMTCEEAVPTDPMEQCTETTASDETTCSSDTTASSAESTTTSTAVSTETTVAETSTTSPAQQLPPCFLEWVLQLNLSDDEWNLLLELYFKGELDLTQWATTDIPTFFPMP